MSKNDAASFFPAPALAPGAVWSDALAAARGAVKVPMLVLALDALAGAVDGLVLARGAVALASADGGLVAAPALVDAAASARAAGDDVLVLADDLDDAVDASALVAARAGALAMWKARDDASVLAAAARAARGLVSGS